MHVCVACVYLFIHIRNRTYKHVSMYLNVSAFLSAIFSQSFLRRSMSEDDSFDRFLSSLGFGRWQIPALLTTVLGKRNVCNYRAFGFCSKYSVL